MSYPFSRVNTEVWAAVFNAVKSYLWVVSPHHNHRYIHP